MTVSFMLLLSGLAACDSSRATSKGYDGILTLPGQDAGSSNAATGGRGISSAAAGIGSSGGSRASAGSGTASSGGSRASAGSGTASSAGSSSSAGAAALGRACSPSMHCGTGAICSRNVCTASMLARYCHCLSLGGKPALLKLELADAVFPSVRGLDCSPCMPVPTGRDLDYRVFRDDGSLETDGHIDLDPSWNGGEVSIFSLADGLGVVNIGCNVASFDCPR